MRVVVQSYEPKVVCVGQTATRDISQSCQSLLDTMLISETPMTFGYVAGSVERMPYSRVSSKCSQSPIQFFLGNLILSRRGSAVCLGN